MRICWFNDNRLGLVEGDRVRDASMALEGLPKPAYPFPPKGDPLIANLDSLKPAIRAAAESGASFPVNEVRFLSPVAAPTKIIGTPTNYRDHIAEADRQREVFGGRYSGAIADQGLFLKAISALIGPGEGVRLRFPDRRTDHEMELGVIIGRQASDIRKEEALDYVAGYSIALDMVVRGTQDRSFRKSIEHLRGAWSVAGDRRRGPRSAESRLLPRGQRRGEAEIQHQPDDHGSGDAGLLGFELLHAMAPRHHHERHLLGCQPGKAGRRPALRDRQARPLRRADSRMSSLVGASSLPLPCR